MSDEKVTFDIVVAERADPVATVEVDELDGTPRMWRYDPASGLSSRFYPTPDGTIVRELRDFALETAREFDGVLIGDEDPLDCDVVMRPMVGLDLDHACGQDLLCMPEKPYHCKPYDAELIVRLTGEEPIYL